jgi:ribose-phosphate pyrophosphokinase
MEASVKLKIFGLNESADYARLIAAELDTSVAAHVEHRFDDGETYGRSDENVRGCDVYVISSLYSGPTLSAGEKLTDLLFFIGSLTDASAGRITVVMPYLGYARQDRKTESRAPISTKYLAKVIEAVGADRVLTMDVHNLSAFQNAFRIPTDNLEAKKLLVNAVAKENLPDNLVVMSPDSGGMSRARWFRAALEKKLGRIDQIPIVYLDKERKNDGTVHGDRIVGDVKGKNVIVVDDMVASGKTIATSRQAIESHGGQLHSVCATHGLFVGKANEYLEGVRILVTDSVPSFRLKGKSTDGLSVISTAKFFAQAIRRTHTDGSISEMLT